VIPSPGTEKRKPSLPNLSLALRHARQCTWSLQMFDWDRIEIRAHQPVEQNDGIGPPQIQRHGWMELAIATRLPHTCRSATLRSGQVRQCRGGMIGQTVQRD
jgi:hypothetical protein